MHFLTNKKMWLVHFWKRSSMNLERDGEGKGKRTEIVKEHMDLIVTYYEGKVLFIFTIPYSYPCQLCDALIRPCVRWCPSFFVMQSVKTEKEGLTNCSRRIINECACKHWAGITFYSYRKPHRHHLLNENLGIMYDALWGKQKSEWGRKGMTAFMRLNAFPVLGLPIFFLKFIFVSPSYDSEYERGSRKTEEWEWFLNLFQL